jgi:UDP-N-acetylglucosamine--N-acetylmuramyl-(pentapeptide) pyrophosphoryl-undecaprenol N-acetylglucosamine transferase
VHIAIAGGFTGGHIFCALAIARALKTAQPDARVLIVGARGGMEVPIARAAGFPVETVWLDGLERRLTARAVARSVALPLKLGVSLAQAGLILRRFRPDVAVGVGAYVSFPTLAAAALGGVPVLLHEANARPGIANQVLARVADVVCVGLAAAAASFGEGGGGQRRIVHTGNPIRADLSTAAPPDRREACVRLGLDPGRKTLLVMGGSLGASRLNEWVLGAEPRLAAADFQVLWQAGPAHVEACRARFGGAASIHLIPFVEDMPGAYAASDLVVAGAGAMTLAELAYLGQPAVIVPDRNVSEDHQLRNSAVIRNAGGLVCEDRALGAPLTDLVVALMDDDARRRALGARMAALATPGAAERIAAEIVALAGRRALHRTAA